VTYDLCIIGAGVGGGALAHALAPTGKRILLLNRLGSLPREADNWDPKKLFLEGLYKADERWTDDATGETFRPDMFYWLGGNTKVYGSALLRFRPEDFGNLQTLDGLSPAWPITYDDLAPFYDRAERLYHVHGTRGADPFEPPASGPLPHPAIPHDERIDQVAAGLQAQGIRAFELPMGVKYSHEDPGGGAFVLRETFDAMGRAAFDGYPDLLHLKADAETATVTPALDHDNVDLVVADVTRIVTDAAGTTVTHVEATVDGEPTTFQADVFALCAGAINTAALLLRSASSAHPDGLANGSGAVGRHLMRHVTSKFYAIDSGTPNPTRFQKTLAVNDFYFGVPGDPEWDGVPLGHVHLMGKHAGWQILQDLGVGAMSPEEADVLAAHSVDWWVQSEDLPLPDNRVTVGSEGGLRVRYTETNRRAQEHLMDRLEAALREIGFDRFLRVPMPLEVMNHQCGTCRMGTDTAASVVDASGRTHEVGNLYLADASVFPSSAATNPTLTIAANALRVAGHLSAEVL
jgi:choline dehydrogenase-like flavoprotein